MITTFASLKGGTGKTTITGLLANYCSQILKKRVIIIDIDPQGGCTTLFLGLEAREIIDGSMPLVDAKVGEKPLSIAIDEMNQGKMTIIAQDEEEEE